MTDNQTRGLILGRIRDILGTRRESAAVAYQRIAREYTQEPTLSADARVHLFIERLEHYQVAVHRCSPAAVATTIAATLGARKKSRVLIPPDIDSAWLAAGFESVPDAGLSYQQLDASEGVLTGCSLAIANTGTLVLRHAAGEGRRALTLIPDYHLCVVFEGQVVQSVPEAMRQLAQWRPALVTTISGPSATADIEMTRIRGVHGPRTLDVIVVKDAAALPPRSDHALSFARTF